ncbi:MAG: O-antigen ligase family protein, partial [Brevinematales bacterium]
MKKYLILLADITLVGLFLGTFFWNGWFILGQKPLPLSVSLPKGDYIILSHNPEPQKILVIGEKTNTIMLPEKKGLFFLSLKEASLVVAPTSVVVYLQKGLLVHSFVIGVLVLLLILFAYWMKTTRELDWGSRFFLFALLFGWSGTLSVFFLFLAVFSWFSQSWKTYHFRWYHALVVGFFFWAILSGILARFPLNGIGSAFLFLGYILIAFTFRGQLLHHLPLKLVGRAIVWAFLTSGAVSFWQQIVVQQNVGIWNGSFWLLFWPYHKHEIASLFEWSARGGYWLGLMTPFLFALFLQEKNTKEKIFLVTGLVIGIATLLFTQSRGGFVLAFVGIFVQLLFLKRGYLALLLLLLPLTFVLVAPDSKWAQSIKNPLFFHTNVHRLHQIQAGLDFWKKANPLTGIGLMNFKEYYYEKRHNYDIYAVADYLHQGYLAILVETGIVGWILFYSFFVVVWMRTLRFSLTYRTFGSVCLGILTGFLT